MNLIRIFLALFIVSCLNFSAMADNHSKKEEVVDKAKEITKKLQEDGLDEVPLNDPFAGNEGSNRSGTASVEVEEDEMSLYNFKLVGIVKGKFEGYASLINSDGELITLQLNEELSEGVKLVELRKNDAVFEKDEDSYLIINFKNQIKETSGEY